MDTRTIHWFESSYDLNKIDVNKWQFQIAKMVATSPGSPPVSNVIWKSVALQPQANISWPVKYGLNWSATLPTAGITVTVGGRWQACDKGEAFDLTRLGEWVPSRTAPTPGWMTVGNIDYQYPGVSGIHLVVGVMNPATGSYDTIFIDTTELPPGSSGSYQPQEEVKWWLEGSSLTGSVYSKTRGSVGGVNLSSPAPTTNKYEYWTTYLFDSGSWVNTQTAPPAVYTAPIPYLGAEDTELTSTLAALPPTVQIIPWPWIGFATFSAAVATFKANTVKMEVKAQLDAKYTGVSVEWEGTSGTKLNFSLGKPRGAEFGSFEALGFSLAAGVDDPKADVNAALQSAASQGDFPPGETWNITTDRLVSSSGGKNGAPLPRGMRQIAAISNGY
ncbi:hypothetical protein GE09DRAFT_1068720 [Coniochaeta sp. 2T2.1]|nr:hypothetical protein GE09DRAFT_1068720 [Coniochaeta sp. 2T2.1]